MNKTFPSLMVVVVVIGVVVGVGGGDQPHGKFWKLLQYD